MYVTRPAIVCLLLGSMAACAAGDDWPCWRGPERNGISAEKGLLRSWPADGPKVAWTNEDLGLGSSSPAIADGRVYVIGLRERSEFLTALTAHDGKKVWEKRIGAWDGITGQLQCSTPTIDEDRIYVLTTTGDLSCLSKAGEQVWSISFKAAFGQLSVPWRFLGESPLVDGDRVLCMTGSEQAAVLAVRKKTGKLMWKARAPFDHSPSHSSLIPITFKKERQYVGVFGGGVAGLDAKTGKVRWSYGRPPRRGDGEFIDLYPVVVHEDGFLFFNAFASAGLLKIAPKAAEKVYVGRDEVACYGGAVLVGQHLYYTTQKSLRCVDFKSGKAAWEEESASSGSLISADGLLFIYLDNGMLVLAEASPKSFSSLRRFDARKRPSQPTWAHPALSDGKLYIRDQGTLIAYEVKTK